jgi:hypothetical protein
MNIGKSFTFVFEDQRWLTKVGIGTLVLILAGLLSPILIGILGYFIIVGYGLDVVRNVRRGISTPCLSGATAGASGWCWASRPPWR